MTQRLAVLQPRDRLDRITLYVAGERSGPAEVDGLTARFDLSGQGRRDRQHGLDALATDAVVDDAEVLARVLDLGLEDDQRAAYLPHALVQLDGLTA